jgi:hypothetical protein
MRSVRARRFWEGEIQARGERLQAFDDADRLVGRVEGDLATVVRPALSMATRSVKVPPTSSPIRSQAALGLEPVGHDLDRVIPAFPPASSTSSCWRCVGGTAGASSFETAP